MCDYEDMRDTETQSTAGQSEEQIQWERDRLSYLFVLWDIHRIKGNYVSVAAVIDIFPQRVNFTRKQQNVINNKEERIYILIYLYMCIYSDYRSKKTLLGILKLYYTPQGSSWLHVWTLQNSHIFCIKSCSLITANIVGNIVRLYLK